jgi:hypothetical protein
MESVSGSFQDEIILEQHNRILQKIKLKVQLGGDACLRRFNSFGKEEFSASKKSEAGSQSELSKSNVSKKGKVLLLNSSDHIDISESAANSSLLAPSREESNLSRRLLDADSELLSQSIRNLGS